MPPLNPFIHNGSRPNRSALLVLIALALPVALYSTLYHSPAFFYFVGYTLLGIVIDTALRRTWKPRSISGGLTAALLVAGLPVGVPFWPIFFALLIALGVAKHSPLKRLVRFNAAMLGRFFLMLVYNEHTVDYGQHFDALTSATPLDLYKSEEVTYLFLGKIKGLWEDFYTLIPGSPGETFPLLLILLGLLLFFTRIASWRAPVAFLLSFAATTYFVGDPVVFSLFSGAVLFSAVFIVSDPLSTPTSKSGRLLFGCLVGIATACLRHYTYYTETVVFAVIFANLCSPLLDKVAFQLQGIRIQRRKW